MNSEQVNALNRVLAHFGNDEVKYYREAGEPSGHIAQSLLVLEHYIQHRQAGPPQNGDSAPDHPLGQASPIGIVRDHPNHDEDKIMTPERYIIFALLPLAKLPNSVENLVRDAVREEGLELRPAVTAALERIYQIRDPDSEIPF